MEIQVSSFPVSASQLLQFVWEWTAPAISVGQSPPPNYFTEITFGKGAQVTKEETGKVTFCQNFFFSQIPTCFTKQGRLSASSPRGHPRSAVLFW